MADIEKEIDINVNVNVNNESVNQLNNTLSNVAGNTTKVTGTTKLLSNAVSAIAPGFASAASGASAFGKQLLVLAKTPIGAFITSVVLALTGLYKAFTSTADGADMLENVLGGLNGVLRLGKEIALNFIEVIKALSDGDIHKSVKLLTTDVGSLHDAFQRGYESAKAIDEITDSLEQLQIERAKIDAQTAQAREISTDENATYQEKKKAIKDVQSAYKDLEKTEGELLQRKVDALARQYGLEQEYKKKGFDVSTFGSRLSKDEIKAIQDAQIDLLNFQEDVAKKNRANNRALAALEKKERARIAAEEKADAEERKAEKERQFKEEELLRKSALEKEIALTTDETDKALKERLGAYEESQLALDKQFKDKLISQEAYNTASTNLQTVLYVDLDKIEADGQAKQLTTQEKANKEKLDAAKKLQAELEADLKESNDIAKKRVQEIIDNDKLDFDAQRAKLDAEKQIQKDALDAKLIDEKTYNENVKALSDARTDIDKKEYDAKTAAAQSYADALSGVSDLVGKETAVGKATAIASTTISTYLAAQQAYASQLTIPTPDAPVRATIAAGLAIAQGLLRVKSILAVKIPKGGAGGGASPTNTGGASGAPAFASIGNNLSAQLAATLQSQNQKPIKTYVVGSDVTTQQALDRNRVQNSTFL